MSICLHRDGVLFSIHSWDLAIGIELNPEYCKLIADRFKQRRIM
jgi:hypothetical protein